MSADENSGKEYGYHQLSKVELRKTVADLTKSIIQLKEDKKTQAAAINDVIKDVDARIKAAVAALQYAEATSRETAIEVATQELLETAE